jgi:3-hydroxy acid dehydrogenase / malonic semialdehyde reductase
MAQIALVTGATSGIGEACARIFAEQKFNLIITGRRTDRLEKLSDELKAVYGVEVVALTLDVRDSNQVKDQLNALDKHWKEIDVLVNNAGLSQGLEPIQEGMFDDWDTMIDTNIKGLLYVTKVVSSWMVERMSGHIVNLGSIAGKETYANGNVYCATKHAVDSLNKAMRIDLLPYNIRVTGIHPGAVETEFSEVRFKGDKERARKVYQGFDPLTARDIAETIWFAVSRPAHVNISDLLIMPTAQATAGNIKRNE